MLEASNDNMKRSHSTTLEQSDLQNKELLVSTQAQTQANEEAN